MYQPKLFVTEDPTLIRQLIERNGFVSILSFPEGKHPFINHLPVIFSPKAGEEQILVGHMSRKNPQWVHFQSNPECTILVTGEHSYISPRWYKSGRDVPTWNYAVAHLYGKIELRESFADQVEILKQLTAVYEGSGPGAWQFELPHDLDNETTLTRAIVSFRFHIEKVEAKFKLSQNRTPEDKQGVLDGLEELGDDMSLAMRKLMSEINA